MWMHDGCFFQIKPPPCRAIYCPHTWWQMLLPIKCARREVPIAHVWTWWGPVCHFGKSEHNKYSNANNWQFIETMIEMKLEAIRTPNRNHGETIQQWLDMPSDTGAANILIRKMTCRDKLTKVALPERTHVGSSHHDALGVRITTHPKWQVQLDLMVAGLQEIARGSKQCNIQKNKQNNRLQAE